MPMYLTAMIPPLWFAIMNPRVMAVSETSEGKPAPARAARRQAVEAVFDRWGGYLMEALIVGLGIASSRLGFANAILYAIVVGAVFVLFRETFVLAPLRARSG